MGELSFCSLPDRAGLKVSGEICLPTFPVWERALERLVAEPLHPYHLDVAAVTFTDVAGVTALAVTAQRLDDGQRIVLHRPPRTMSRMLELFWPELVTIEVAAS
ncbi:STAS domain-containing protein [Streptomyces indicus]|uniref:STAS domain-containing protein n=1 Tax=Streptomyces indicus TaxID=417292 RepID=UPI003CCC37A5